jgi:hypothetical protein
MKRNTPNTPATHEFKVCGRCDNEIRLGFGIPWVLFENLGGYAICGTCGRDLDRGWWSEPIHYTFPIEGTPKRTIVGMQYVRAGMYTNRRIGWQD